MRRITDLHHKYIPKKKLRIALIDDNEGVYFAVRGLLEAEGGHRVAYFESPETFLDAAQPEDFDCILLDYLFNGGMDGMDLLRHLAALRSATPVVMVTSREKADLPNAFDMCELGAKALLMKPFVASQLWEALRKAMLSTCARSTDDAASSVAESLSKHWENKDLEDLDPKELDKDGRAFLLLRAQKRLNPSDFGKLASLTLTETKVFLLRSQHDKTDRELADILGTKTSTWQTHIENASTKLGTRSVLQWRILFDRLNTHH